MLLTDKNMRSPVSLIVIRLYPLSIPTRKTTNTLPICVPPDKFSKIYLNGIFKLSHKQDYMQISDLLFSALEHRGDKTLLTWEDGTITYRQTCRIALRNARLLKKLGVSAGDRVILCAHLA